MCYKHISFMPYPSRSNRALSFLHNWTKRARPTLGVSNSRAGSKGEATLGRRRSTVKENFDTPPPPPPAISTSSALVQYMTAGTFVHGPTTTAISSATSRLVILERCEIWEKSGQMAISSWVSGVLSLAAAHRLGSVWAFQICAFYTYGASAKTR
ncbi:hypothetical protein BDV93DRAFT_576806 [Ceratobasidium sp. AG-I]|nr:hypothetical protein BDV93DRAFT_576806 [Ceratobasidium sp. AG-I]